jgi:glycosyltransferase involved in cell wall biosynthesis
VLTLTSQTVAAVITTHLRPTSLMQAIESVRSQSVPVSEILICEDGHDERTRSLVAAAAERDSRIRHLHVPLGSRGAGANRNVGLEATHCEWVAFLDDDDLWLPEKIESQLALIDVADVICANAVRTSGGTYFPPHASSAISRRSLLMRNKVITSTCVVRRSALQAIGGFSSDFSLLGVEDYECWLRLSDVGARFAYLDHPVIKYADEGDDRLSARTVALADVVTGIAWRRAMRERTDAVCWMATGRHALTMGTSRARRLIRRIR